MWALRNPRFLPCVQTVAGPCRHDRLSALFHSALCERLYNSCVSVNPAHPSSSPRAGRTARTPFTSIPSPEDDAPPTTSLRDAQPLSTSPIPPSYLASSTSLPPPPSLQPTENTTTLLVFGPPNDHLPNLRGWLEELGPIASYVPGPDGTNWYVVEYVSPVAASYALRRHGDIVGGRWIVGFKVITGSQGGVVVPRNPGSAIQVQNTEVLKPKKAPAGVVKKQVTDGYAWDESEAPTGVLNKAAEWLVSSALLSWSEADAAVWPVRRDARVLSPSCQLLMPSTS